MKSAADVAGVTAFAKTPTEAVNSGEVMEGCGEAKYCKRCEAEPELTAAVESRSNCVATV